jgi:hypothetical protein
MCFPLTWGRVRGPAPIETAHRTPKFRRSGLRRPASSSGRLPWAGRLGLFDALSYTHRKEYARWVAEAKKQVTRDPRAAKAIEMLLAGKTL